MLEEYAGRTMQLRHDDPFRAVDDEGAGSGHKRNFAHVHFLLLHFLDFFGRRLPVQDHQTYFRAQRAGKSQAALLAFLDVKRRLAKTIFGKLQTRIAGVGNNGENRGKRRLQAMIIPCGWRQISLQKLRVRVKLRC